MTKDTEANEQAQDHLDIMAHRSQIPDMNLMKSLQSHTPEGTEHIRVQPNFTDNITIG